jgi:hypothetical protein
MMLRTFENEMHMPKWPDEKEKKESLGLKGAARGSNAACIDAAGSSMGSVGLFVFAIIVWQFMPRDRAWIVLGGATLLWLGTSVGVWQVRKGLLGRNRKYCFRIEILARQTRDTTAEGPPQIVKLHRNLRRLHPGPLHDFHLALLKKGMRPTISL